jgi:hypothetical protein
MFVKNENKSRAVAIFIHYQLENKYNNVLKPDD